MNFAGLFACMLASPITTVLVYWKAVYKNLSCNLKHTPNQQHGILVEISACARA
jgi:hypothetical protein